MGLKEGERMTVLVILVAASFALGWFWRGDKIYSAMYARDINSIGMTLPVDKGIRK